MFDSSMEESNKDEVRQSPRLDKLKQMKIDEAKRRKSPRLELEKGKNKVNLDDDDDFVETNKVKRASPRLKQTQLKFKPLNQDEVIVVNENGMSPKKPEMTIVVREKGMKKKKLQRKISQASPPMGGAFRCCTKVMVAVTQNMKMALLQSHKEVMLRTPFGRFFTLFLEKRIKGDIMSRQNKKILFEIINRFSVKDDGFLLGEGENVKLVKFEPEHVALTFGLPLHGMKVTNLFRKYRFDPDQSTFLVKHNLQHPGDIQRNAMISNIQRLMTEEGCENDFCRMVVLLMSATIFFPNSNQSIGKSFVVHLENLETTKKLGWTDLIYNELMKKLRNNKNNPLSVSVCVIPLLVWLCEITGIVEPRSGYIAGTPRIGKWNFTKLSEAWDKDFLKNITKDQIKDKFQGIEAEEKLLLEEVNIQQEDDKPKDYEQLYEENIELKAEIVKLKRRIDELEIERSEGASNPPKKLKLKLKLDRSRTPKEYVEVGDEERQKERVEVQQEEGQQETVVVQHEEKCHEINEVVQEEVQQLKQLEDDGKVVVECNMSSEIQEEATNKQRVEKNKWKFKTKQKGDGTETKERSKRKKK